MTMSVVLVAPQRFEEPKPEPETPPADEAEKKPKKPKTVKPDA